MFKTKFCAGCREILSLKGNCRITLMDRVLPVILVLGQYAVNSPLATQRSRHVLGEWSV